MKSGYIAIVGLTNAGKSTLLNYLLGQKISITSYTPQTTLSSVYGILTTNNYQMVFLDTPGVQKARSYFDSIVQNNIKSSTVDVDCFIHLVDEKKSKKDEYVMDLYRNSNIPVILAINKYDIIKKNTKIDEIILSFQADYDYAAYVPISSVTGKNTNHLLEEIEKVLEEGDLIFDEEEITNISLNKLMCDIVREKTMYQLKDDVVSSFFVSLNYIDRDTNTYYFDINVNKESIKKIIIGKNASVVKKIKELVKRDFKRNLDLKINVDLFVKIIKNWKENDNVLSKNIL